VPERPHLVPDEQPEIYPIVPVITSNRAFASLYDRHPRSIYLISGCLEPRAASTLLDQGAAFDTVVLLNGEGEEVVARLIPASGGDEQLIARVERIDSAKLDEDAVAAIHLVLREPGARAFFRVVPAPPARAKVG
jgi:hypothetical protein